MSAIESHFERAKVHFLCGLDHLENGRWISAELEFKASLRHVPDRPSTLANLGACLIRQEKWDEAASYVTQSLNLDQSHAPSWLNQGLINAAHQDFGAALTCYDQALSLQPEFAQAWSNKGLALSELSRHEEAFFCLSRALELDQDRPEYWSNRAVSFAEQGRFDEALRDHEQAIALGPEDPEAHYNRALLLLRLKQFRAGFEAYEWRWKLARFSSEPLRTHVPPWRGPGHGGRVLLWSEQGLGDEILYASLVSLLRHDDACFTLSVDARLVPVIQRSMPTVRVISHSQEQDMLARGEFDAQAPTGSLGRLLGIDESSLKNKSFPYLKACPSRVKTIRERLDGLGSGLVCGLSWRSKNKLIGLGKSISLNQWSSLMSASGWSFVNLQYGDVSAELAESQKNTGVSIEHIEGLDLHNDIEGLLALVEACDCIITSSNVTAHLAGAIGKKALVLVPHGKSKIWYWHDQDADSLWYPSLQLIHQSRSGEWRSTMQQALDWLTRTIP